MIVIFLPRLIVLSCFHGRYRHRVSASQQERWESHQPQTPQLDLWFIMVSSPFMLNDHFTRAQTVLTSLELSISHVSRVISREIVCKSNSNSLFLYLHPHWTKTSKKKEEWKWAQRKRQHVSHGWLSRVASWALRFYGCGRRRDAASWQCWVRTHPYLTWENTNPALCTPRP